ncbi:hypothetical protein [Prosthecobacter fluviatilis]|uniref:Uncharacterized protein n=1 Tax=Prosthecobacter fluviatilis TaxID=445931 RepID=A0ABW0KZ84_9BACT
MNPAAPAVQRTLVNSGKSVWTLLVIGMTVVDVCSGPNWFGILALLHAALFLKLIWMDTHG